MATQSWATTQSSCSQVEPDLLTICIISISIVFGGAMFFVYLSWYWHRLVDKRFDSRVMSDKQVATVRLWLEKYEQKSVEKDNEAFVTIV